MPAVFRALHGEGDGDSEEAGPDSVEEELAAMLDMAACLHLCGWGCVSGGLNT